ncbi:coiled-coil domain-containing protein 134-like [Oratosquilla oratoria]|uniref:coiled-coil domain-containing protein 134-like n=1 Tax=Oratosquilla oratoria TaxID=337810 RepID=UPI003F76CDD0
MNVAVLFPCLFYISCFVGVQSSSEMNEDMKKPLPEADPAKLFEGLFKQRRAEHQAAVKSLQGFKDYAKQYKMIEVISEKAFQVLEASQIKLRENGYVPGMDFPVNEDIRDALSQTLENTALLGEILLHMPDKTHRILRKNKQWKLLFTWGIFFATESKFLDSSTYKLMKLVSQELDIAEKDPSYVNPYSEEAQAKSSREHPQDSTSKKETKTKKKKSFRKGPRLSRGGEL